MSAEIKLNVISQVNFLCVGLSASQQRIKLKSEQPDSLYELPSNVLLSFSCRSTFRLSAFFGEAKTVILQCHLLV